MMYDRRKKRESYNGIERRLRKDRRNHLIYRLFLSLVGYHRNVRSPFSRIMLAALTYACILSISTPLDVYSNPVGGSVVAGSATISSPNANTVQVNQTSDKAILNWQSFNIAAGEKTQFVQPSASSVALNRINPAQGASQIYGQLSANGRIILVNQAGIHFGPGARVDVGGIIASTSNISNENFLAGNYVFDQPSSMGGSVINEGTIIARNNGLVALIGTGVVNNGMIQAKTGSVVLASGNKFTISFDNSGLINFSVDEEASQAGVDQEGRPLKAGVTNRGRIHAPGGTILVSAKAASGVLDNVINMEGVARAKSVSQKGGVIILSGGDTGTVRVAGKLDVSSAKNVNAKGGTIKVLGKNIRVESGSRLKASGKTGGGQILIGGNARGAGPEKNATTTYIAPNVKISADARVMGDGGKVVVWADEGTAFFGDISAKGGTLGGDGGWVETSGKQFLIAEGKVDTTAPRGKVGTWLLDPTDITISTGSNANYSNLSNVFTPNSGVSTSIINTTTLANALASSNIEITTNNSGTSGGGVGNITIANPLSWSSGNALTLTAANNILINAAVTIGNSSTAQLILNAIGNVTQTALIGGAGALVQQGTGTTTLSLSNTYTGGTILNSGVLSVPSLPSNSGNSSIGNTGGLVFGGGILSYTGGSRTLDPARAITINSGGGTINVTQSGTTLTMANPITGSGTLIKGGAGGMTLSGATNSYGGLTLNAGTLTVGSTGAIPTTANLTVNAGTLQLNNFDVTVGSLSGSGGNINQGGGAVHTLTVNQAGNTTFAGNLTASNPVRLLLTKQGAGNLTLTGNNTYTGATTVIGGTLTLGSTTSLGNSAVNVAPGATLNVNFGSPGTLTSTGAITLGGTLTGSDTTFLNTLNKPITLTATSLFGGPGKLALGGIISGVGFDAEKTGTGTLSLTNAANTYSGGTLINAGILSQASLPTAAGNSAIGTGNITLNGGTLSYTGSSITMPRTITVGASGGTLQATNATATPSTLTLSGGINLGANALTIDTSHTGSAAANMTIATNPITQSSGAILNKTGTDLLTLNVANTLSSGSSSTNILGGTLRLGVANALGSGVTALTVTNPGILDLNSFAQSVASTSGTGTITNTGAATTYTTNDTGSNIFSGVLSGNLGLTKAGSGTLTLSGTNSYTGATAINAGRLSLGSVGALGNTSTTTVSGTGAALDIAFNNNTLGNTNRIFLSGTGIGGTGALTMTGNNVVINNPITLQSSSTIGGTGSGVLTLGNAITGTNANLSINLANAGVSLPTITLSNSGSLSAIVNGPITLNNVITTASSGNSIVLSGSSFNNLAGASALNPGPGNFLVWSSNPGSDNRGGIVYNFKQYNATYGSSPVQGSGSGFLYTVAPTITPSLTGTTTKSYTGTTTATLTGSNYIVAGAIDSDIVTLNNPTTGTYSSANVGTNLNVSASGIGIASATNSGATVYGYQLASTTANATIGEITKAPLTITANNATKTYGQTTTFAGNEFSASGLQNSETVGSVALGSTGAIATANVQGGTPYAITAADATGGTFNAANYAITYANGQLTVNPAALTVTANNATKTYGQTTTFAGNEFSASGLQNAETIGSVALGSTGAIATANVQGGTPYAITAADATGGTFNAANYAITYANGQLTVNPAALTVTANNATKTYGQTTTFAGNEFSASGLQNAETIGSVALGSTGAIATANVQGGTPYAITAADATGGTFNAANYAITYANGQLTVNPAALTVTANNATKTYGQTTTFAGNEFSASGLQNAETIGSVALGSTGAIATANVQGGTPYAITATDATGGTFNAANYAITYANGQLTVNPAALTVTANNATKTYGQTTTFAGNEFSASGLQNAETIGSVALGSTGAIATANVQGGTPYAITAADATGGTFNAANYAITYANGQLTVNPAALTVTANNATKTYGQTTTFAGNEFSASGLQNSETVGSVALGSTGAIATANVQGGTPYAITAADATGGTFNAANYAITYANGQLTVNPAALTVTANNATKTYGQTTTFAGNEFSASGLQNAETIGSVALGSTGAIATANVQGGTPYAITAADATGGTFNAANYAITYANGQLTVNPAALTVTANNATKTYGQTTTFAGNEFSASGLQNAETIGSVALGSTGAIATANVQGGTPYAITAADATGGTFNAANYAITYANGQLTVNPAALTVTANNATKTYGQTTTFAGNEFSASGLQNAETIGSVALGSTGAIATANVQGGTPYAITAADATGGTFNAANYAITYANGQLTVNPAALTVTANNATKTYGQTTTFAGNEFSASGLQNAETIGSVALGSTGAIATANVQGGTPYAITAADATGGTFNAANYAITYANGQLTVNPATLTYNADKTTVTADTVIPVLKGNVTGFVNGETQATATLGTLAFSTPATSQTAPGSYPVVGSGLTAKFGNYIFTQSPSNATAFTINPASATIPDVTPSIPSAAVDQLAGMRNTIVNVEQYSPSLPKEATTSQPNITVVNSPSTVSNITVGNNVTGVSGARTAASVAAKTAVGALLASTKATVSEKANLGIKKLGETVGHMPDVSLTTEYKNISSALPSYNFYFNSLIALFATFSAIFFLRKNAAKRLSFKMRTALNNIVGFTNLIYQAKLGPVTPQEKEYLEEMLSSSDAILQELNKIESSQIYYLDRKMAFNLRSALMEIDGYAKLIQHQNKQATPQQEESLHEIRNGSEMILNLLTAA